MHAPVALILVAVVALSGVTRAFGDDRNAPSTMAASSCSVGGFCPPPPPPCPPCPPPPPPPCPSCSAPLHWSGYGEDAAGQPYVGASLSTFIAWDSAKGEIVWSVPEPLSVLSGALATAGGVVFHGTLTGEESYEFKTLSGIIGNAITGTHGGKQYVGLAAGLERNIDRSEAVGTYRRLSGRTQLGGVLAVGEAR